MSGCHLRYDVAQPLGVDKVKVLELKRRIVKVQQNSCREKQPDEMWNAKRLHLCMVNDSV